MASKTQKRKRNRKIMKPGDNKNTEAKRKLTLKNKAKELATLCDVKVCMVCFGLDGEVETWPENKAEVEQVFNMYKGRSVRESLSLLGFLRSKKAELNKIEWPETYKRMKLGETSKGGSGDLFLSLEKKINQFSEEELLAFSYNLGHKIQGMREKLGMMKLQTRQYAVDSSCSLNYNRNDQLNMGTHCYQPSETLGWCYGDTVLAAPIVISGASPEGHYMSNGNNPSLIFSNQPASLIEDLSGQCYVNAESSSNNQNNCLPGNSVLPAHHEDWISNSNNTTTNLHDHSVLPAHHVNNDDWISHSNITTNNYDDSYLFLGLEDPNWFWGTSQLCFLD